MEHCNVAFFDDGHCIASNDFTTGVGRLYEGHCDRRRIGPFVIQIEYNLIQNKYDWYYVSALLLPVNLL